MKRNPTEATWLACKTEYVTGQGSLEALSEKHGLSRGSVWLRNKKEGWQKLRKDFEKSKITALFPSTPVINPPAPTMPEGGVSPEWLLERQRLHYSENMSLLDLARGHIKDELQKETAPSPEQIAKLTMALASIVVTESTILGLKNRKTGKNSRPTMAFAQPQE